MRQGTSRHDIFALASEGMYQGEIAARVEVAWKPVNRIFSYGNC